MRRRKLSVVSAQLEHHEVEASSFLSHVTPLEEL
jgi:hypothetical protein